MEERGFSGGSCGPELPGLRGILRKKQTSGRASSLLGVGTVAATAGLLQERGQACSQPALFPLARPQTRPGCDLEQGPGSQEHSFTPMKWKQHCVHLEASPESKGRLRVACGTAPGVNTCLCTCVWELVTALPQSLCLLFTPNLDADVGLRPSGSQLHPHRISD